LAKTKTKAKKPGAAAWFILISITILLGVMWQSGLLVAAAVEGETWMVWLALVLMVATLAVVLVAREKRRA